MMRDVIRSLRSVLIYEERIGRLADDVSDLSRSVREELGELRGEQLKLDRRISRLEGGLAMVRRLSTSDS